MLKAVGILMAVIGGLLVSGAAGIIAAGGMIGATGEPAAAMHLAQDPVAAVVRTSLFLVIVTAITGYVGRIAGSTWGLLCAGYGVAWFASRTGGSVELLRQGALSGLALESMIWAGVVALIALGVHRVSVRKDRRRAGEERRRPARARLVGAVLCGLLVLPVVWLIARSPMKGQVIAATTAGAIVCALAAALIQRRGSQMLLYALPLFAGAIGYLVCIIFAEEIILETLGDGVTALALPMPQDYAAGALLGVTIGIAWARSLLASEDPTKLDL